mgnify:CR=1 FL=1
MSVNSTDPESLFGGIWERIGNGRTLVGVDEDNSNFNTVSKTGGESSINLSHSHTVNAHSHTVNYHTHTYGIKVGEYYGTFAKQFSLYNNGSWQGMWNSDWVTSEHINYQGSQTSSISQIMCTAETGSSNPGTSDASPGTSSSLGNKSIIQPYITVYMWKRIK